ncbi:small ribosomal subunit protein uS2m [Cloeon dipterum]|uniref:small ribosomal subunit protein uS2m n=1 Tax=Cloeon dipterum TaxID=197152 RepID=UPI00321FD004
MLAIRQQIRGISKSAAAAGNAALQDAVHSGSDQPGVIYNSEPLKVADYFGIQKLVKVKDMFEAKVHLGHMEGSLHPAMKPYLYGSRLGHCVFDLDISASMLRRSLHVLANIVYRNGVILFMCPPSKSQAARATEMCAQYCNEFSHVRHWKQGTFTNSSKQFGLVTRLPDLCVFMGTPHDATVECAKMNIPTLAILDSNADPALVTYHIPGNDDSMSSINYFSKVFSDTIKIAKAKKKEDGV